MSEQSESCYKDIYLRLFTTTTVAVGVLFYMRKELTQRCDTEGAAIPEALPEMPERVTFLAAFCFLFGRAKKYPPPSRKQAETPRIKKRYNCHNSKFRLLTEFSVLC